MKATILIFFVSSLLFLLPFQLFAQDASVMAQSQYFKAEEAYNNGNYEVALKALDKAEGYAGNNNLIQYLRVKSLYGNEEYTKAKNAIAVFFNIIDPSLKNSTKYNEMVMLVAEIDEAAEIEMTQRVRKEKAIELRLAEKERKKQKEELRVAELLKSGGAFIDERDDKMYNVIKIGAQTWMAENLNFAIKGSYYFGDKNEYKSNYGLLYTWETALNACPDGWHLPSYDEWESLVINVGCKNNAGVALKSSEGWKNGAGTNTSGFYGLPGGWVSMIKGQMVSGKLVIMVTFGHRPKQSDLRNMLM